METVGSALDGQFSSQRYYEIILIGRQNLMPMDALHSWPSNLLEHDNSGSLEASFFNNAREVNLLIIVLYLEYSIHAQKIHK